MSPERVPPSTPRRPSSLPGGAQSTPRASSACCSPSSSSNANAPGAPDWWPTSRPRTRWPTRSPSTPATSRSSEDCGRTRCSPIGGTCAATSGTCGPGVTRNLRGVTVTVVGGTARCADGHRRRGARPVRGGVGGSGARRGAVLPPVLRRRRPVRGRSDRGHHRASGRGGDPEAAVGDRRGGAAGGGVGGDPDRAAGPGHPRGALRRRVADHRARRPRPARPRRRHRAAAGLRKGGQSGSVAAGGPGPGAGARSRTGWRARGAVGPVGVSGGEAIFFERLRGADRTGGLGAGAGRGAASGARRPGLPPRAAPFVRHPHGRPGGGHPGGPGAAGARQRLDDPGVHEGVGGAAASGVRRRHPEPGEAAGRGQYDRGMADVPHAVVRASNSRRAGATDPGPPRSSATGPDGAT